VEISKISLLRILIEDLFNIKNLGKLNPHGFSEDQKQARVYISYHNLLRYRRHPMLVKWTLAIDEIYKTLHLPAKIIKCDFR
jgi:hypothetical protein